MRSLAAPFLTGLALGAALVSFLRRRRQSPSIAPRALLQHKAYGAYVAAAVDLALEAGSKIRGAIERREHASQITSKGVADVVTETDKANERLIFEGLRRRFPSHELIGEESSADDGKIPRLTDAPTWIVDPIDGTSNFCAGLPLTCVSIGLCVGREPVVGVVYNPLTEELYVAARGCGAYLNGEAIACTKTTSLQDALVIQEYGYEREDGIQALMQTSAALLRAKTRALRQLGSGALDLCFVAAGRADAVFAGVAHDGLCEAWKPWDYCAGKVICEEAGAIFRTFEGRAFDIFYKKDFICAAPGVMEDLRRVLNSAASADA